MTTAGFDILRGDRAPLRGDVDPDSFEHQVNFTVKGRSAGGRDVRPQLPPCSGVKVAPLGGRTPSSSSRRTRRHSRRSAGTRSGSCRRRVGIVTRTEEEAGEALVVHAHVRHDRESRVDPQPESASCDIAPIRSRRCTRAEQNRPFIVSGRRPGCGRPRRGLGPLSQRRPGVHVGQADLCRRRCRRSLRRALCATGPAAQGR